ncbi:MAG: hypothetical protein KJ919_14890 [Verrucomicrobia bacterium]|nr:hypothetical protein [Verrucomicrobiota bacterium]
MDNTVNHKQRSAVGRRPAGAHCLVTLALILSFIFFSISVASAATKTWITTTGTNNWFVGTNWSGAGVPGPTDDVVITNANTYSVLLTGSVAIADFYIGGGRAGTRALVFSNWNTTLTTTNVTVQNGGSITLPAAFTNNGISNNVYIVCSNLTILTGGSINADAKGYSGALGGTSGYGPGAGGRDGNYGYGGGYGGRGGGLLGGWTYGAYTAPANPGSGGGSGVTGLGGNGGGAISIIASNTITVNGTITANGGAGGQYGGGGSGGGVYLVCNTFVGTNGNIRVNGGTGGLGGGGGGGGGGGRIAVIYNSAAQGAIPVPTVCFSAAVGTGSAGNGDIGTLCFPDNWFLGETITIPHIGQWMVPGWTNWSVDSLTISNAWIRFSAEGFQLTVTNNMTIMGSTGRLELACNSTWWNYGAQYSYGATGPVLNVGGNLTLTNGGRLFVYSAMTNASNPNYGALVSVVNDVYIGTGCWIYPYSHWTNGGSPLFRMRHLFIATSGGFSAGARGYSCGLVRGTSGYGPGFSGSGGGAGYGGVGGGALGGATYGSSNAPVAPGSGGYTYTQADRAGNGGGLIRVEASGVFTLNGTMNADGEGCPYYGAGSGSGGGVYLKCKTLRGSNGILSAKGGVGTGSYTTGGGGGRIAVWRA